MELLIFTNGTIYSQMNLKYKPTILVFLRPTVKSILISYLQLERFIYKILSIRNQLTFVTFVYSVHLTALKVYQLSINSYITLFLEWETFKLGNNPTVNQKQSSQKLRRRG